MHNTPRLRSLAALAGIGTIALAGCAPIDGGGSDADSTVTFLIADDFDSLDPALTSTSSGRQTMWMTYETMLTEDPETGGFAPGLAESWKFTPTHLSFTIREGAMCNDGSPITAETVARNFERLKDPKVNAPLTVNLFGSTDYKVTFDEAANTVDVDLPVALPFINDASNFSAGAGIICGAGLEDPSTLAERTSGSGPYEVTEYVVGDHITLGLVDGYKMPYDGDTEGMPKRIVLDMVAEPNTQVNLLLGGDADIALLEPQQLERLEGSESLRVQPAAKTQWLMLFNQRKALPFSDAAVRIALTQAVDRDELSRIETGGAGTTVTGMRPDNQVCVDPETSAAIIPSGGIDAGQKTLEEAGWAQGTDGIYERDGQRLTVRFFTIELSQASVEYLRSTWSDLGVDVQIDDRAAAAAVSALYEGTEWDFAISGFGFRLPTGMVPFFAGPASPAGPNFGAVVNEEYSAAVAKAQQMEGLASCPTWQAGEDALLAAANSIPAYSTQQQLVISDDWEVVNFDGRIVISTLRHSD